MRKLLVSILALAVGMTAKGETSGIWTNYKAESFSVINTEAKTITIHSAAELALFAYNIYENGNYRDYTVTLGADIDLAEHLWIPIGLPFEGYEFTGTFYGQGHTISNLEVYVKQKIDNANDPGTDVTPNNNLAGLFGKIGAGGTVKDVYVSGPFVGINNPTATCSIGGIAGINAGTIVGCGNAATVTSNYSNASVGGIAGTNTGTIQNCYNLGEVYTTKTDNKIGGIAGNNSGTVSNCFIKCTITTGRGSSSEKVRSYPLVGNNGGTLAGCFYTNGTAYDVPATNKTVIPLANASSNSTTISDNLGSGKNILLQGRTLYADGDWNTICLPFDIPAGATGYSPIAGATVMTLASTSFSAGTLTFNFTNTTSIEAGKPYIVKWDTPIDGDLPYPVFMNVTVSNSTTNIETSYANFVGSFSPVSIAGDGGDDTKLYLGPANAIYYPNSSMTINSCRAYFELNDITAGDKAGYAARAFVLNSSNDETNGIILVEDNAALSPHSASPNHWFTLDGRRLSEEPTQRGIYIHNGKKVAIR